MQLTQEEKARRLAIVQEQVKRYNTLSGTHNYLLIFTADRKKIECAVITGKGLPYQVIDLDSASKGAGWRLKFKPTKAQVQWLEKNADSIIDMGMTEPEFEKCFNAWRNAGNRGNRGNYGEVVLCNRYGATKNACYNACFTDSTSDLYLGGLWYEVKCGIVSASTIVTEATLERQWKMKFPK